MKMKKNCVFKEHLMQKAKDTSMDCVSVDFKILDNWYFFEILWKHRFKKYMAESICQFLCHAVQLALPKAT